MGTYVIIDVEATGNVHVKKTRIIDIALIVIQNGKIIDKFTTLINPETPIPSFIASLTHIDDEDVKDAPLFADVAKQIKQMIASHSIVGHNVLFDVRFLNKEFGLLGMDELINPIIDTVELSKILYPTLRQYKLSAIAKRFNLSHDQPHRALSDTLVTGELFLKLIDKLSKLPYETKNHLNKLIPHFHSNLSELIYKTKQKNTTNNQYVTYNELTFKNIFHNERRESDVLNLSFGELIDDIYGEKGKLMTFLPNYDYRKSQQEISEQIYDAFQLKRHTLIEAATGTGKTLAYLIPALYEAHKQGEPIVISTEKINLQFQLLEDELPKLKYLLPFSFRYVALKGKHHYLNLAAFHDELVEQHENYHINLIKAMILIWITETETGDFNELSLTEGLTSFLTKISAKTNKANSKWDNYCYYNNAFKKSEQAHLIIVNHALLCSDLYLKNGLIPTYRKLIIDEAHQLAEVAKQQFSVVIDFKYVLHTIKQIMKNKLNEERLKKEFRVLNEVLFDCYQFIIHHVEKNAETEINDDERLWQLLIDLINRIVYSFTELLKKLNDVQSDDMCETLRQFSEHFTQLGKISFKESNSVTFARQNENNIFISIYQPYVNQYLAEHLFKEKQSVILTSATLTVNNSFQYISEETGIYNFTLVKKAFKSPFHLTEQTKLMVPNDFPSVQDEEFIYVASESILSLINMLQGNIIVLFTSHDMLQSVYYLLDELIGLQYNLIAQNITHRNNYDMLNDFKMIHNSILLGTNAFWEGIDVPGESLRCLIIVKLPFDNPKQPQHKLKHNLLKAKGINSFYYDTLPRMIIKLRQGIGRLIRNKKDKGVIYVLDNRLHTASYAEQIQTSINEYPLIIDSTANLMSKTEQFLMTKK